MISSKWSGYRLEPHRRFYILFLKRKFDVYVRRMKMHFYITLFGLWNTSSYVLWPFDKNLIVYMLMFTTSPYLFNLKLLVPTWYIFSILSDVSVLLLSKLRSIHLTYRPKYVTESSRQKLSQRWRIEWGRKGAGTSDNFGIDKTVSCQFDVTY